MFSGLLGSKFSNKCKHSVKCIKCRMETIRKKKIAMERYLKKDVADLVSTGHDANAFGRMDALLFEINQTSCYDMIEQYCYCILEHLPTMQKERECPKETVEAVATLVFAAARFSDLPELADLRRGFTERFRTTMEAYTNREFIEKLQKKSFQQDEKLQLMKDIAMEFKIDWDVKSFEHKMSNPSAPTTDHSHKHFPPNNKNYIESHVTDERSQVTDRRNEGVDGSKTVLEKTDWRRDVTNRRNVVSGRKAVLEKAQGTIHLASEVQKQHIEFEKLKTVKNNEDQKITQIEEDEHHYRSAPRNIPKTPKKANAHPHDSSEKINKVASDESEDIEPPRHFSKRPPYVKTIGIQNGSARKRSEVHEGPNLVGTDRRGATRNDKTINMFPPDINSCHDTFVHPTTKEVFRESEHNAQQRQPNGAVSPETKRAINLKPPYVKPKVKSPLVTGYVKPTNYEMNSSSDNGVDHKKTAFSVRTKRHEQRTAHTCNNVIHMDLNDQQDFSWQSKQVEDDAAYYSRRNYRTENGECDREEQRTYKLSQHYSKTGFSNQPGKARTGTREPQSQSIFDSSRFAEKTIKDEQYYKLTAHTPTRTVSLPPTETPVGSHVRSVSMQPDLLSPNGERSHPRLPDYDELAARIAALRKS